MAFTERSSNKNIRQEINELFDSLGVDVTGIEEDLLQAQNDITTLQSDVTDLEAGIAAQADLITAAQTSITAAEASITTLQGGLTTAQNDINTAEADIDTLQTGLSTLQGDLNTAETEIDNLQATGIEGNKTANLVFAAPSSGSAAPATFRALVQADIPYARVETVSGTSYTVDLAALGNPRILYLSMTNTAARAVTLPALSAGLIGLIIIVKDTALSAATGNVTISAAGGNSIVGSSTIIVNGNSTRLFALSATQWGSF